MRLVIALALVIAVASAQNPRHCGTPADTDTSYYYAKTATDIEAAGTCETNRDDNCEYAVGDLTTANPTSLDVTNSRLAATGSTDYIYLVVNVPDKYYNHQLVFPDRNDTAGICDDTTWSLFTTTHTDTVTACSFKLEYRSVWENAYGGGVTDNDKCGWESAAGASTTLTLDFGVTVTEDIGFNRAGMQSRNITFSHPARVSFPTQVNASTVDIQVFSPVRTIAAITGQAVTIDETSNTATLELVLFTEVQDPFELHKITQVSTLPTGVSAGTDMTGGNDDGTDGTDGIRGLDTCTTGTTDCSSSWTFTYTMSSITGACQFDGDYEVGFEIKCANDTTTDCPIDSATNAVNVDFTIDTSDHCPSVIDTVFLEAWLYVWGNADRDEVKDDFVGDGTQTDGQTPDPNDWQVAYFSAPATSTQVQIDYTLLDQVWIDRSTADDIVLLDTRNSSNNAPYDTVDNIVCDGFAADWPDNAHPDNVTAQTGCNPLKPGGGTYTFNFKHGRGGIAAAGQNSTAIFEFDIRTDAAGFNMADDAIETMTVHAVLDVGYSNAAKRAGGMVLTDGQVNREATASFRFTNGNGNTNPGTNAGTGSSGSTALMSGTVLMGAAALAAIAVIAVVAIVVRRRRRVPAMQKVESTAELTTV